MAQRAGEEGSRLQRLQQERILNTRLGFLVPPGNPTVEPEMIRLAPPGVTVHFTRMMASGEAGAHAGQEERNRSQIAHLEQNVALLAMVKPAVIAMAHAGMSTTLGREGEARLVERLERSNGIPFITAFGSVIRALEFLGVQRVAVGTPYSEPATQKTQAHLEAYGIDVVSCGRLENVRNIYDETPQRAAELARKVDVASAQAVFLSGLGLPTVEVLDALQRELRKPVLSGASALMWNALRVAGVQETWSVPVFGQVNR